MATTPTFFFNDIFENYEQFKELTDELQLYEPEDTVSELFNQYFFSILFYRYLNNSVAYSTPDEFKSAFAIRYIDVFSKYLFQKANVEKVYKLSDEDLAIVTESLANQSLNPNKQPERYWETINYISAQAGSRVKNSKLVAYLNAIRTAPTLMVEEMTDEFIDLFLPIYPHTKYYF